MPFELFVALRYLRDGRLQTALILTGIGVGVGVIIFLSALITGLQASLVERTLGSQPLIVVRPSEEMPRLLPPSRAGGGEQPLELVVTERPPQRVRSIVGWQEALRVLRDTPGILAAAPTITGPGIVVRGRGSAAVSLRGIEPESYEAIVNLDERLVDGRIDVDGLRALIGVELAGDLGAGVGSRIRLQVAGKQAGVYTVSGVFDYGNADLNERLVFVSLRAAQTLFDLPGGVSEIEVRHEGIFESEAYASAISDRLGLVAESWIARNEDLLVGLRSQGLSSIMIQVFVIVAVALGIASVLTVSVVQRSREIGILRATGTRTGPVTRIFLLQGAILGTVGSIVGIAIGTSLALFFAGLVRNPDGSPTFPANLTLLLYARSVGIALAVGVLAAVVPARNAARMDPAAVIRDA